jgi:hypothetical protein
MLELLAIPSDWTGSPVSLDDWSAAFAERGHPADVEREPEGDSIEVGSLRLCGLADAEGDRLVAIHFELFAPDPGPARAIVEDVARALGWEVHEDDEDDE